MLYHGRREERREEAEGSAATADAIAVEDGTIRLSSNDGAVEIVMWHDMLIRLSSGDQADPLLERPEGTTEDLSQAIQSGEPCRCVDRTARWVW